MFRIAVCDDEQIYIDEFKEMLKERAGEKVSFRFYEFHSGEELLNKLPEKLDLIVLDVQLGTMNGNDVGKALRERGYKGLLVLCSGIFGPVTESFVISAYRYMLKQDSREKNLEVIDSILSELKKQNSVTSLTAVYEGEMIIIKRQDIAYIARHRLGSEIFLNNKELRDKYSKAPLVCREKFDELYARMNSVGFAMPHNSYMVNLEYVTATDKNEVRLGDIVLSMARSKQKQFGEELLSYLNKKYS